jgi:hypothetical protein
MVHVRGAEIHYPINAEIQVGLIELEQFYQEVLETLFQVNAHLIIYRSFKCGEPDWNKSDDNEAVRLMQFRLGRMGRRAGG